MKPQSPCRNCTERVLGCHSECDLYLTFRRALDRYNELYREQRTKESQVDDYLIKQMEKRRPK